MAQTGIPSLKYSAHAHSGELPWPLAPWFLWFADVLALELSLLLAMGLRALLSSWWPITIDFSIYVSLALSMVALPFAYAVMSLYPGYGMHPVERLRRTLLVTGALFVCVLAWSFLFGSDQTSRGILLFTALFALVLVPMVGALAREALLQMGYWGTPVIILGANKTGVQVAASLQKERYLGLIPVGFLDNDPLHQLQSYGGVPVLGGLELVEELSRSGIREALVALPDLSRKELNQLVSKLPFLNIVVVPDLSQEVIHWSLVRELGLVHGIALRKNLLLPRNRRVKYWMDKLLGWPMFMLSLPIIGLLALWIRAVSPGSAFFTQNREGLNGKLIRVWKLRTMYPDAEARLEQYLAQNPQAKAEWERSFKLQHDPRILPGVGHFLRRTSLDELPQLVNVVMGEMSLVGPRPFPVYHLEHFPADFREIRHSVLPGVTGFWQVWARSDSDLELQEALDTYYIRNWSPWLDIYLLCRTVLTVLLGRGAV